MKHYLSVHIIRSRKDKDSGLIRLTDNFSVTMYATYKITDGKTIFAWVGGEAWKGHDIGLEYVEEIIGKAEELGLFEDAKLKQVLEYGTELHISKDYETEDEQETVSCK